jgi:tellurite resistance protein
MSEIMAPAAPLKLPLDYLPVGFFGSVMGLTGLSVSWRLAYAGHGGPVWVSCVAPAIGVLAVMTFVALLAGYAVKLLTALEAVKAEFNHPIGGNLFGTISISMLLLPIVLAPYSLILAQALWGLGAVTVILFAWFIVSRWMSERQQAAHATPAWIIPVVGLLDVPLAVPTLGFSNLHGLMVFCVAVGLFFAVPGRRTSLLRHSICLRCFFWPSCSARYAICRFAVRSACLGGR